MTKFQNHHIIPRELFKENDKPQVFKNMEYTGIFISHDSIGFNLIALPEDNNTFITNHQGRHSGYTDFILAQLDIIEKQTRNDPELARK